MLSSQFIIQIINNLITLNDSIILPAEKLDNEYAQHLEAAIKKKYEGNRLKDVFFFKVLEILTQSGHIHQGDSIFQVTLKILGLRILDDEIYYGKIVEQYPDVIVQFFHIKAKIDKLLNVELEGEVFVNKEHGFYYEIGEEVRFKVNSNLIGRMDEPGLGGVNWWN